MNFLRFDGMVGNGATEVALPGAVVAVPQMIGGASGALVFGVRPENVHLADAAPYKGRVVATEYLGTTQIVTLDTECGVVKARVAADRPVAVGETTGLRFDARSVTLFDAGGRALISAANQRVLGHG